MKNNVLSAIACKHGLADHQVMSFIAKELGMTHQNVSSWFRGNGVPLKHCFAMAKLSGLTIREIRPDIDFYD